MIDHYTMFCFPISRGITEFYIPLLYYHNTSLVVNTVVMLVISSWGWGCRGNLPVSGFFSAFIMLTCAARQCWLISSFLGIPAPFSTAMFRDWGLNPILLVLFPGIVLTRPWGWNSLTKRCFFWTERSDWHCLHSHASVVWLCSEPQSSHIKPYGQGARYSLLLKGRKVLDSIKSLLTIS